MVTRVIAALALLSVMGQPAWAGNSYFHLPPSAFRLIRGDPANCFPTTTDNVTVGQGASGSNPEWVMGTPVGQTNCVIGAPFTMPTSNLGPTVQVVLFAADGQTTANKYCYKTRLEVGNNWQLIGGASAQGWANLDGSVSTPIVTTFTGKSGAFVDQTMTSAPMTGRLISNSTTSLNCPSTGCNGLPGILFIERCECGGESGTCGSASDAGGGHFFEGASVFWPSP